MRGMENSIAEDAICKGPRRARRGDCRRQASRGRAAWTAQDLVSRDRNEPRGQGRAPARIPLARRDVPEPQFRPRDYLPMGDDYHFGPMAARVQDFGDAGSPRRLKRNTEVIRVLIASRQGRAWLGADQRSWKARDWKRKLPASLGGSRARSFRLTSTSGKTRA